MARHSKTSKPRNSKTNRSLKKRVKITGRKKILKRPPHQNHFNAKESGERARNKKGQLHAPKEVLKKARALLANEF
ncbi:MAG: 50S ribosomal protein L35 [Candidatus Paceibacterota bacterium]|nr:MAG: 50S ribosomal protein L35 [Candidatus Paceibacterota bacterium]